jgi:hypothetical protein
MSLWKGIYAAFEEATARKTFIPKAATQKLHGYLCGSQFAPPTSSELRAL